MTVINLASDRSLDFRVYQWTAYDGVLDAINGEQARHVKRQAETLAEAVRQAADRSAHISAPAKVADEWIEANLGEVDDRLRRAVVAGMARILEPDDRLLPRSILELYPSMHMRLARFLSGPHSYNDELFAKDVVLAAGATAPMGPLTIAVPTLRAPRLTAANAKRAAGGFQRQLSQRDLGAACEWLALWGARPWVELHVDTRDLREFHLPGFIRGYHRLADLMALRPDLAGVYGASWIYQPELSEISPKLAFARATAEAAGGKLVRLRADPQQTAFALARSPTRKRLYLSGQYKPICYGMFWARDAIINWSGRERLTQMMA